MFNIFFAAAGFGLILFTLIDAFVTILSLRGGGPATTFVTRHAWRFALKIHQIRPAHTLLAISGPLLLIIIVIAWYGMLYFGWFLIFSSIDHNIFDNNSLVAASIPEKLYFTGTTISGLGFGDFTARDMPWTLFSTLAVFTGTLLTSLALSYIIAVVPVALEKRQIAIQINAIGGSFDESIAMLSQKDNVEFIWEKLFDIQLGGTSFSNKYGAYPVVSYFHSSEESAAFSLAYLKSTDLLFYIANHPNPALRPPMLAVRTLRHTTENHVRNIAFVMGKKAYEEGAEEQRFKPQQQLQSLAANGEFTWDHYKDLRRIIAAACVCDGW